MGGYQLAVAMDIFRGRYRESFETPKAIASNVPLRLPLRAADRQPRVPARPPRSWCRSSRRWFPLYDRNPQTFVPNIFFAKPEDYVKATQRVYRGRRDGQLHRAAGGSGGYAEGVRAIRAAVTNSTSAMPAMSVPRAMKPTPSHQATPALPATSAR